MSFLKQFSKKKSQDIPKTPETNLPAIMKLISSIKEIEKAAISLDGNIGEAIRITQTDFSSEHPIMYLLKEFNTIMDRLDKLTNDLVSEGRKL